MADEHDPDFPMENDEPMAAAGAAGEAIEAEAVSMPKPKKKRRHKKQEPEAEADMEGNTAGAQEGDPGVDGVPV